MIVGSLLLILFMTGLGLYLHKVSAYIASSIGILAGISGILVGIFPMNHGSVHTGVAVFFFYGALLAIILFNLIVAASVLVLVPLLIFYLIFQRAFVQGIVLTGLKY